MISKDIIITLDNKIEYGVIETQVVNGTQYALLANINDKKDIKINKVIKDENGIAVVSLYNYEEYLNVYPYFYSKMKKFIKEYTKNVLDN